MLETDLLFASATQLVAWYRERKVSPVDVIEAVLHRIDRVNPRLNAFCHVDPDQVRADAVSAGQAVGADEPLGPLHGVPISVKDNLDVKGSPTQYASRLMEGNVSTTDCPAVERLRKAGAIIIGRTTMPEFGWKGVTDSPIYGITRNPWNPDVTPGGSTGGGAAAVAGGMGVIAVGTDAGGSLRIPGAFCNLVGFKPSSGRIPNHPPAPGELLRHIGPLTRTVTDAALAVDVMAGPDERDLNSLPATERNLVDDLERGIDGLTIAWCPRLVGATVDPEIETICAAAVKRLEDAGARVEPVELELDGFFDSWKTQILAALSARLEDTFEDAGGLLDRELLRLAVSATVLRSKDLILAQQKRHECWHAVRRVYEQHDLLATPTLGMNPFPIGQNQPDGYEQNWVPFLFPFNLTGQPAISVPCGWTAARLPVGLQLVGRRHDDVTVLRAARAFEQLAPWAAQPDLDWNWPLDDL